MEQIKTRGLILKACNLNDNDRLFTVMTDKCGKITVMAKGIRSQKNKYFAAMQLFCLSDFVFERKTGMYYPVDARVAENFYTIRTSVEKVALATYMMDVVNAVPDELPLEPEYFSFILNTLFFVSKIDYGKSSADVELLRLKSIFELKTACENGYMPQVKKCQVCSDSKNIEYFDVTSGEVVCSKCFDCVEEDTLIKLTPEAYRVLHAIVNSDTRAVFSVRVSAACAGTLSEISQEYLRRHAEIYPMSLDYLIGILQKNK